MRKRAELLSQRTEPNAGGLIYAVVFACPNLLPDDIRKHIQYKDLSLWATNQANFRESKRFETFENEIKLMCGELWTIIQQAPQWEEWPIVTPEDVSSSIPVSLPRLR